MTRRFIVRRSTVLAAQGLIELHEIHGWGTIDAQDRAIAAARKVPGGGDAYEVVLEEEPA